jgi:hypothetical protein
LRWKTPEASPTFLILSLSKDEGIKKPAVASGLFPFGARSDQRE